MVGKLPFVFLSFLALSLGVAAQNQSVSQMDAPYQGPPKFAKTHKEWIEAYGFAPFSVAEAVDIACNAGVPKACDSRADPRMSSNDQKSLERAFSLLKGACGKNDATACATFATWMELGISGPVYTIHEWRAREIHLKACNLGSEVGCVRFGLTSSDPSRQDVDPSIDQASLDQAIAEALSRVCSRGSLAVACAYYANFVVRTHLDQSTPNFGDALTALRLSRLGCDAKQMRAPERACQEIPGIMKVLAAESRMNSTLQLARVAGERAKEQFANGVGWFLEKPATPETISFLHDLEQAGVGVRTYSNMAVAARAGQVDYFPHLLARQGDINAPYEELMTPLMAAAVTGNLKSIAYFIDRGAKIDAQNIRGGTALLNAVVNGHVEAVGVLLRAGAKIDLASSRYGTPLYFASHNLPSASGQEPSAELRKAQAKVAQFLVEQGANPNYVYGETGETPLFGAIRNGHDDLANMLLDAGANPNLIAKNGLTPRQLFRQIAERRAEEERVAEQKRLAALEAQRQAALARQQEAQKKQGGGFLGSIIGMAAGAVMGSELGLQGDQIAQFATTMGGIGRVVETGNAGDAMAARSSVDSLGSRLNSGMGSGGLGGGSASGLSPNQRTEAAAAREGYNTEMYSFTCPSGRVANISVPYKTPRQLQLRKELARTSSCNMMDESQAVQNQCTAEFGNPYCQ